MTLPDNPKRFDDLAKLVSDDLLPSPWESSQTLFLLDLAATALVKSADVDVSDLLPYAGEWPPAGRFDDPHLLALLTSNEVVLARVRQSVSVPDLTPGCLRSLANTNVADHRRLQKAIHDFCSLLFVRAVVNQTRGDYEQAHWDVTDLFELARVIMGASHNLDWYIVANLTMHWAIMLILWIANATREVTHDEKLLECLERYEPSLSSYVASMSGELFHEVVATFAMVDAKTAGALVTRAIVQSSLPKQIYSDYSGDEHVSNERLTTKGEMLVRVLKENPNPLLPDETLRLLGDSYRHLRGEFVSNMRSALNLGSLNPRIDQLWPDWFQLTSANVGQPPGEPAVELTEVTVTPNALGLLLLRDVMRAANTRIRRLLLVPWREQLDVEACRLILATNVFQTRFGTFPKSTDQLLECGILRKETRDRLTGVRLDINRKTGQITGPSLPQIQSVLQEFPVDAPLPGWKLRRTR